ncbi:MAG TPA: GspMb/PilO family protein [Tepidisphaeraceae bacterium]|jgi:hypothetical protein|nr:GspMb/PilO family protein [Tepidisphaeraceae bacterium]
MKLSNREKYVGIGAAVVIGLFALDSVLLSPLLARLNDADQRVALANRELREADQLFQNSLRARRKWKDMAGDTVKTDESAGQSQLLNRVDGWAQDAGLPLSALKTGRGEGEQGFQRISVQATAAGTMAQVSRFLYSVHTAKVPVRVSELQIASRKEGTDDLALQVSISSIYAPPPPPAGDAAGGRTGAR